MLCIYAARNEAEVVGLDISSANLVKARDVAKSKNLQNCSFILGDIYYLPFKENLFDRIACIEVLEHLIKPNNALKEIIRVAKKETRVVITVPNLLYPWRWMGRIGLSITERIRLFLYGIRNGFIIEDYRIGTRTVAHYHRVFSPFFLRNYLNRYFKIQKIVSSTKWNTEFLTYVPTSLQRVLAYSPLNTSLLKYFGYHILCVAIKNDAR